MWLLPTWTHFVFGPIRGNVFLFLLSLLLSMFPPLLLMHKTLNFCKMHCEDSLHSTQLLLNISFPYWFSTHGSFAKFKSYIVSWTLWSLEFWSHLPPHHISLDSFVSKWQNCKWFEMNHAKGSLCHPLFPRWGSHTEKSKATPGSKCDRIYVKAFLSFFNLSFLLCLLTVKTHLLPACWSQ